MSRSGAHKSAGSHVFPFLAVLICTMGALVMLLVVIARNTRAVAVRDAAASVQQASREDENDQQDAEWRASQIAMARDKTAADLAERRLVLSQIEDHLSRLRGEANRLETAARELERTGTQRRSTGAELERELDALKAKAAAARRELTDAEREAASRPTSFAVVPYVGPNQTRRRPIYIECRADSVVLQPEGIRFGETDFMGSLGPGNPLASSLRSIREYLAAHATGEREEPYPLLLVRPDGILAYNAARAALSSWGAESGYELVGADWDLAFPEPDPRLESVVGATVAQARERLRDEIASAPSRYAAEDRPKFTVNSKGEVTQYRGGGGRGHGGGRGGYAGHGTGGPGGSSPYSGVAGYGAGTAAGGQGGSGAGTGAGGRGGYGVGGGGGPGGGEGGDGYASAFGGGPGGSGTGSGGPGMGTGGTGAGGGNGPDGVGGGGFGNGGGHGPGGVAGGGAAGQVAGGGAGGSGRGSGGGSNGDPLGVAENGLTPDGVNYDPSSAPAGVGGTAGRRGGAGGSGGSGAGGAGSLSGTPSGGATGPQSVGAGGNSGMLGQSDPSGAGGSSDGGGDTCVTASPSGGGSQRGRAKGGQGGGGSGSIAATRGHDWALRDAANGSTPVSRPMYVRCLKDRLVILPEEGRGGKEVVLSARTQDSVDEFVSGVWEHMKTWGMAGKRMHWRPTIVFDVAPDARDRYEELSSLLADSGYEVRQRQAPAAIRAADSRTMNPPVRR